MTKSPTRFEPDVGFVTGAPEMYVNTAGSYIKFEDYEQLKQQLDAVVAENAVLKSLNSSLCTELQEYETDDSEFGPVPQSVVLAFSTETPTTDSVLAAVEAKAVEKYAEQQEEKSSAAERAGAKHLGAAHQFAALQARAFAVDLLEGRV
ncbi:hypothetical protein FOT80_26595 [Serratia fonticola]|nr:hypothetical protein [Serratia fonticola]